MTSNQFEEYRLTLLWYTSDLTWQMCNKIKSGINWKNDAFKIFVLNKYIDIMLEHTLQTESDYENSNINFLSNDGMLLIQFKINELLNTDFNYDFYLDA